MKRTILVLAANPIDTPRMRLDQEVREISNGLERARIREEFVLKPVWATRPVEIRRAMLDLQPSIVHFCGHGSSEGIYLEDDQGQANLVQASSLADFFSLFVDTLECVILNACYSETQAEAVAEHIPYVIGMKNAIADTAAIEFAVAFYDALGAGKSYEFAYNVACNALQWNKIADPQVPILIRGEKRPASENVGIVLPDKSDWGNVPALGVFFGRNVELVTLERWVVEEHCKVVLITGMAGVGKTRLSVKLGKGGIGKTDLTLKFAEGIQSRFDYVLWRSLLTAAPLETILLDAIKLISDQKEFSLPQGLDHQISRLLDYLRAHRCLLILDNMETILAHDDGYREGYEGYGELIRCIGEAPHQSCLLLTSRQKPRGIAKMEGGNSLVRSLTLGGLDQIDGRELLEAHNVFSEEEEKWAEVISFYNGNPLALELTAKHIQEVFFGDIAAFLKEGRPIFQDLRELIDWHFDRLSDREKEVMYWLAINREPVSLRDLQEDVISSIAKDQIPSTLQSLQRRVPIERGTKNFTLQPVLIEYMTEKLIEHAIEDIHTGETLFLNTYALLKASAKDYVRENQNDLILRPINTRLLREFRNQEDLRTRYINILSEMKRQPRYAGYVGGNILNLLCQLKVDLSGGDFSNLVISQAYLQKINLRSVNFSHSDLSKSVFNRTFEVILSVAFHPNGDVLAAGTGGGEVQLWRAADGEQLAILRGHTEWVSTLAFNVDGSSLASGSWDNTVRLWDVNTGECSWIFDEHDDLVLSVAFSPNGGILASSSADNSIRLWQIDSKQCLAILNGHTNWVQSIVFSKDGTKLASSSNDNTVRLWDVNTGECIHVFEGHTDWVRSVVFSHDCSKLASSSYDNSIRIWDANTQKCLRILKGHSDKVISLAFNPTTGILASSSYDQTVRMWDIDAGKCIRVLSKCAGRIDSVAFNPQGDVLASCCDDGTVQIWDANTGQCLKNFWGQSNRILSVAHNPICSVVACGSSDQSVRLWDIQTGQCVNTLHGHTSRIDQVTFSSDGKLLASASDDQTVRLWDVDTGKCIRELSGHADWVWSAVFNPDNTLLASSDEQFVYLWDIGTGKCVNTLRGHTNSVWSLAFDSSGRILVSSSKDHSIRFWDVTTGQCLKCLKHIEQVERAFLSHDAKYMACGGRDKTVQLWDAETGKLINSLSGHSSQVWALAFSFDNLTLASGDYDATIRLWSIGTGTCLRTLKGHKNWIWAVAFSPDGKTLISGSHDESLKVWNTLTGECISTFRSDRPYEGMDITNTTGLTEVQRITLLQLGAIENVDRE